MMELPRNLSLKDMTEVFDKTQRDIYGSEVVKNFSKIFLQVAVLQVHLKKFFEKIKCITVDHKTPFDTIQNFVFCSFRKLQTV